MNKTIAGVLIILLFLMLPAYAKPKPEPAQKTLTADDIVTKMKFQLQLTDVQADKIKPIIQDYLEREKQSKLEEKKQLSHVLTGGQMYAWNFIQNEPPSQKKKHAGL